MSKFVKLDCGMLNSTTWFDKPVRDIFITALLMAEPVEFKAPVKQLRHDSLEETGWSAPPGWYGFVSSSGPGLVNRATVDEAAGMEALRRLGDPEPLSRSQHYEGRRLVRVDGGFIVLNYDKYRQKDQTSAERARRYRETHRYGQAGDNTEQPTGSTDGPDSHGTVTVVTRDAALRDRDEAETSRRNGVTSRCVTHVDVEVEKEDLAKEEISLKDLTGNAREAPQAGESEIDQRSSLKSESLPPARHADVGIPPAEPLLATPGSRAIPSATQRRDRTRLAMEPRPKLADELFEAYRSESGLIGATCDGSRSQLYLRLAAEGVTVDQVQLVVRGAKLDDWARDNRKLSDAVILSTASQREKYMALARDPPKPKGRRSGPVQKNSDDPDGWKASEWTE